MAYIIAANLCRFDPKNPLLTAPRETLAKQIEEAFSSGSYNDTVWQRANRNYSGTCLQPFMKYVLWLIQGADCISDELKRKYLEYIWRRYDGIYYAFGAAPAQIVHLEDKNFPLWLYALEALIGFSSFGAFASAEVFPHLMKEVERLMSKDVKLPLARPITGHYSESWREQRARKNDLILRIIRIVVLGSGGFTTYK